MTEGVTVGTPVTRKQPCVKVREMFNLNSAETKLSYFLMDNILSFAGPQTFAFILFDFPLKYTVGILFDNCIHVLYILKSFR